MREQIFKALLALRLEGLALRYWAATSEPLVIVDSVDDLDWAFPWEHRQARCPNATRKIAEVNAHIQARLDAATVIGG